MQGWWRKQARNPVGAAAVAAALLLTIAAPAGAMAATRAAAPWDISTLAGGAGGPGPARQIAAGECAVAFSDGYLYSTGYGYAPGVIRKISLSTGQLTTPAGSAFAETGADADGTPAAQATTDQSCGVTTDTRGNLFFTEQYDDRVEMVPATAGSYFGRSMTAGHVYIIGGDGTIGYSGDGRPAVDAKLSGAAGVTVDPAGNVIFNDAGNDVLRIIAARTGTFYGQAMMTGDIYTVAGGGSNHRQSGIPATSAELEVNDTGEEYPAVQPWPLVTEDQAGNIVMDDGGGLLPARVEVVAGSTGTFYGQAMTAGDIYIIGGGGTKAPDGVPAGQAALGVSSGITLDHAGNILVGNAARHEVDMIAVTAGRYYGQITKAGYAYRVAGNGKKGRAGDGGPATRAEFSGPDGLAVDLAGNIVLADGRGTGFDSFSDNGRLRVVAARAGTFYGVKMRAGDVYTISGARGFTYFGDGGPADHALLDSSAEAENYAGPADTGIAAIAAGGVVFADLGNNRVRVVPGRSGSYFGRRLKGGDIYTIAGNGHPGYTGNRRRGTGARLRHPSGVAVDGAGNVLLTDTGNSRVRVVAARSGRFYGQAMTAGHIYKLAGRRHPGYSGAGGPATSARLDAPAGIALDHHGNVVVCDQGNRRIRVIAARRGRHYGRSMRAGRIYTVAAGLACTGVAVDPAGNLVATVRGRVEVVAVAAGRFYGRHMVAGRTYAIAAGHPVDGVAVDQAGNVILTSPAPNNEGGGEVQVIAVRTGTFYGVPMLAGQRYTIAGAAQSGGLGDGGRALDAQFSHPTGVAVAPSGALLVFDFNRIRVLRA